MGLDIIAASHIDFLGEKDTIINHPPNDAVIKEDVDEPSWPDNEMEEQHIADFVEYLVDRYMLNEEVDAQLYRDLCAKLNFSELERMVRYGVRLVHAKPSPSDYKCPICGANSTEVAGVHKLDCNCIPF